MKNSVGSSVALVLGALSCLIAGAAFGHPDGQWSGQATAVSDYRFRGLTQSDGNPALQAGANWNAANGFHAALWGSTISWLSDASSTAAPIRSSVEADAEVGWRRAFAHGFRVDFGLHAYAYPGDYPAGFTRADTTEAFIALGNGDLAVTYWHALTNLFGVADSHHSGYLELNWAHELTPGWSVAAHLGHQQVRRLGNGSYSDWNASVSRSLGRRSSVSLGYNDSNADSHVYRNARGHLLGDAGTVLALSVSL